jgi:phosphatidylinositol dimannoside acyltransferase
VSSGRSLGLRAWLAGWEAVKLLPEPLAYALGRVGGRLAYQRDQRRRDNLRANLRQVLGPGVGEGELERAVRRGFASYARYWVEAFRLERLSRAEVLARFTFEGVEHLEREVASGRGVVAAVPHIGNWDVGGAWLAARGFRAVAVVERLRPAELFERFLRYRQALGLEVVPYDHGPGLLRQLVAALRDGKVVALVADRDLGGRGVPVTMFGREVTLPAGPAALALRTGAAVLPAAVYQEGRGRWRARTRGVIDFHPSGDQRADTVALTRLLAAELERLIAAAPEQWHVLVPFWPAAPGPQALPPYPQSMLNEEAPT